MEFAVAHGLPALFDFFQASRTFALKRSLHKGRTRIRTSDADNLLFRNYSAKHHLAAYTSPELDAIN
jgi:hypothetical protein